MKPMATAYPRSSLTRMRHPARTAASSINGPDDLLDGEFSSHVQSRSLCCNVLVTACSSGLRVVMSVSVSCTCDATICYRPSSPYPCTVTSHATLAGPTTCSTFSTACCVLHRLLLPGNTSSTVRGVATIYTLSHQNTLGVLQRASHGLAPGRFAVLQLVAGRSSY